MTSKFLASMGAASYARSGSLNEILAQLYRYGAAAVSRLGAHNSGSVMMSPHIARHLRRRAWKRRRSAGFDRRRS